MNMKYRIQRLPYFYICLGILATILSGAISIPFSTGAIAEIPQAEVSQAEVSQVDETKSDQLMKAKDVTQRFFDSLIAGQFEQARGYLSPSLKQYESATDLEQQWQKVLDDRSSFVEYKKIRPVAIFDTYTVMMSANFENSIADFVVTLDSNHEITAVDFLLIGNIQVNAEEFVDAVSNGKYGVARGYLTPELKKTVLPENIEQRWQEVLAETGSFKGITSSKVVQSPTDSNVVLVNIEFEKENRSFLIIFNPLSEVTGIDYPQ